MKKTKEILEENGIGWNTELTEYMLYKLIKGDAKYANNRVRNQIEKLENEIYKQKIITQLFRFTGNLYVSDVGKVSEKFGVALPIETGMDSELVSLFTMEVHYNSSNDIYSTSLRKPTDKQLEEYIDKEGKMEEIGVQLVEGFVLKRVFAEKDTLIELGYQVEKRLENIYRTLSNVSVTGFILEKVYPKILEDYAEYRRKEMEKILEENFYAV